MPHWIGSALAAALLVGASTGPKLWLQRYSAHVDTDRLNSDMARRLEALNFRTAIDQDVPASAVRAWREGCRLIARNGDRARELGVVFKLEAAEYGSVVIGYQGNWSPDLARTRAVFERFAQDGAARIGFDFGRPAVIALAKSGSCKGVQEALSGLVAHARLKTPLPEPVDGRQ